MKIRCLHGYFVFEEQRAGEISDFMSLTDLEIVRKDHYFTFKDLEDAPDFSVKGAPLLSTVATKTFEGNPWDVFRANEMIYNFNNGQIVPISSITQIVRIDVAGNYFLSPGLILPGSLTAEGLRVTDYAAWFSTDSMKFRYSEVTSG